MREVTIITYVAALLMMAAFAIGVSAGKGWWADECEQGRPVVRNGVEYQCTVTVRPKPTKLML